MDIISFEFSWSSLLYFIFGWFFYWTFPLTNKSQVFEILASFSTQIRTQFSQTVKYFQYDNGQECDNITFHNYCATNGQIFRFSYPYTS